MLSRERSKSLAMAAVVAAAVCAGAGGASGQPVPRNERSCAILALDLSLDTVFLVRDLNGDGRAEGPEENTVFFGPGNAEALSADTPFSIFQDASGTVYLGDGTLDQVLALRDLNGDYDAMDENEAVEFFGSTLVFPPVDLATPNGITADSRGRIYVATAAAGGFVSQIVRLQNLNNDDDARDAGEWEVFLNTTAAFAPTTSVLFSVCAIGEVVYFVDGRASASDVVYRVDAGENGTVEDGEFAIFAEDGVFGVPVTNTVFTDGAAVYTHETTSSAGTQRIVRIVDTGAIGVDSEAEVSEIWNETLIPVVSGATLGNSFDANLGPAGVAAVAGNGTDAQDNILLLKDLNFDGDFLDEGETIVWTSGQLTEFPETLRMVLFYKPRCRADFNVQGGVSVQDIYDFLAAWSDLDPCADFNGVGGVSVQDIYDFLSAWSLPCP